MIDLERAADDLVASVGGHRPDLAGVQARVQRRHRRRRALTGSAVVLLVAVGVGALALARDDAHDREQVRTGPSPHAAPRWADHSGMRIQVPAGWAVVTSRTVSPTACAAKGLVLIGYGTFAPDACPRLPSVELAGGGGSGGGTRNGGGGRPSNPAKTQTVNGMSAYLDRRSDGVQEWSVPELDGTITGRHGADLEPILSSLRPSARWVAFDDVAIGPRPDHPPTPAGWRPVRLGNVVVKAPPTWRSASSPEDPTRSTGPCDQWHAEGPTVRTDQAGGTTCEPARSWEPADGLWVLPLDATDVQTDVRDLYLTNANGVRLRLLWSLDPTVLQVVVPAAGEHPATLIRVGLGEDGHVAGSVINSIRLVDG